MKHCKTLFGLVAASIVMLTSGCARQTVHPVPIRYNFQDHIPDYDPMLLDTESVPASPAVVPDTAPAAGSGTAEKPPVPLGYRFRVELSPDREPRLPGNAPGGELVESAVTAGAAAAVRYRFIPEATPDHDPMLLENATLALADEGSPEPLVIAGSEAMELRFPPVRYRFIPEATPDHDPMLLETNTPARMENNLAKTLMALGYGMVQRHPVPVSYRFRLEQAPDLDPMLLNTESVANTGAGRRDSTLAATSATAKIYR